MGTDFEFDVALSFAGEQRAYVEKIAECLTNAGIRVFYDRFEKSALWGKDLYQHLSDIYRNKAEYCIVFASAEYAKKIWTNHELKSAQARALMEKGTEYILPVRFDDTEIPGILPSAGYLDFRDEGVGGICEAFLRKSGRNHPISQPRANLPLRCDFSSRALIRSNELDWILYDEPVRAVWGDEIELELPASDAAADAALAQLRRHEKLLGIAYGYDVAIAKIVGAVRKTAAGKPHWVLRFSPELTHFCDDLEMGTSSTTADEFAEKRVRRLLLNEYPAPGDSVEGQSNIDLLNAAMQENLLIGLNSIAKIKRSDFPSLFQTYGGSPKDFLEIAWISTIATVKLSCAVEHIDSLGLELVGKKLKVEFRGRRHRKYQNVEPYRIDVTGEIEL